MKQLALMEAEQRLEALSFLQRDAGKEATGIDLRYIFIFIYMHFYILFYFIH